MEIHGCDIVIKCQPPEKEAILEKIRGFWPSLVVEEDPEEGEFFVYHDEKAKKSWDGYGWGQDNDADMIYVIIRPGELTLVIDDEKTLLPIAEAIKGLC